MNFNYVDSSEDSIVTTEKLNVVAEDDFLQRLSSTPPIHALCELIWNALDADAINVEVKFHINDLGGIDIIEVIDDGVGMKHSKIKDFFGKLGGSWKSKINQTSGYKRQIHGQNGKGRYMVFSLCNSAHWSIVYTDSGDSSAYTVIVEKPNISQALVEGESRVSARSGVSVTLKGITASKNVSSLLSETAQQEVSKVFSRYLKNYRDVSIIYNGCTINPEEMIVTEREFDLAPVTDDSGTLHNVKLQVVEWGEKVKCQFYFCDEREVPLHWGDMDIRVRNFNVTGYVISTVFGELHKSGRLEIVHMSDFFPPMIEDALEKIRGMYREVAIQRSQTIVDEWKEKEVYPYEGDPETAVERIERDVFNVVASAVQESSPDLDTASREHIAFNLRLMRSIIESNPNELSKILNEVLRLPRERQIVLAELLNEVTLTGIIEAASQVTERLKFIDALGEMLFNHSIQQQVKERSQLHKILEQNTWVFGEQYNLWASDKDLTNVLKVHIEKLGLDIDVVEPVTKPDGKRGIVDLMLSRSQRGYNERELENLVIELKRPDHAIDRNDMNQIEDYAAAVDNDKRFHGVEGMLWHFWIIGDKRAEAVRRRMEMGLDPRNKIFARSERITIGIKTWAEIINENKTRLEHIRRALDFDVEEERSMDYVRSKYGEILEGVTFK